MKMDFKLNLKKWIMLNCEQKKMHKEMKKVQDTQNMIAGKFSGILVVPGFDFIIIPEMLEHQNKQ